MPKFEYKAIAPSGATISGNTESNNANEVAEMLRTRGNRIIYIREIKGLSMGGGK